MSLSRRKVIFICNHNSARSQMAEAILTHMSNADFDAHSAGIGYKEIKPKVYDVMQEVGISLDGHYSKTVEELSGTNYDCAIVVCEADKDQCPIISEIAADTLYWQIESPFPDRKPSSLTESDKLIHYRSLRDQLMALISEWIEEGSPNRT